MPIKKHGKMVASMWWNTLTSYVIYVLHWQIISLFVLDHLELGTSIVIFTFMLNTDLSCLN